MTLPPVVTIKLVIGILSALALALLVHDRNRWKSTASLRQQQVAAEQAAHLATVATYRAAAEQARAADAANVARVQSEQARINERTSHDFQSRIAAARARSGQLRRQAEGAASNPGGGRAAPVPALPAAAGGLAQAAGENGLPATDQLIATEQAIQLDALIDWVRRQHGVLVAQPDLPDPGEEGEGERADEQNPQ